MKYKFLVVDSGTGRVVLETDSEQEADEYFDKVNETGLNDYHMERMEVKE